MINKTIYAYKRKTLMGYNYYYSDEDNIYNHSCVVNKKLLNNTTLNKIKTIEKKISLFINKREKLIKSYLLNENADV